MSNMTKLGLELIPDPDMHIFFEIGTRGGISYISNRYSKANNKCLRSYGSKQESKYILYWDRIIFMVMQCLNLFQQVDSNG